MLGTEVTFTQVCFLLLLSLPPSSPLLSVEGMRGGVDGEAEVSGWLRAVSRLVFPIFH